MPTITLRTITLRERCQTATGFEITVGFDGATEFTATVTDPFTPQEEAVLEWYFEQWLQFPMVNTVRAEQAKASVKTYGEALFQQVFKNDPERYSEYKVLRDGLEPVQIEVIGDSPEFQALHWEALQDPQFPRPLAVDWGMVRKQVKPRQGRAKVLPSPVVNLLVVTARPDEEKDVGYRTISRPLIEAIDQSKLRVKAELLRPATFEALSRHLDDKGPGFYHIIHLDMHGGVMTYEESLQVLGTGNYLFRFGKQQEPFEGVRAFLAFETGIPGQADLRDATELAELLTGKGVPVCILNACQSAKQVRGDERETSLGARLMQAGMEMVLAMGYSVTVTAAKLVVQTLYQQLFTDKSLGEAIRWGRKALWDQKERRAHFNQTIRLEDWLLPVVYVNRPVNLQLRPFSPQEEEAYWQHQGTSYQFEPPTYGFVGRDLDILKLERALLRHNILLVQGMGGTGKTTLLTYLRAWWPTTRFVQEVFYFGYDQQAYRLEQILFTIGQRVYPQYEAAQFQAMPLEAQVAKLVATLKATPYGLMLDNLESVTGQALAIQNTLNAQEQEKLRDFLRRLGGGRTQVVLGSRSREAWLESVLNGAVYELRGLDREARTALAEKILERQVGNTAKMAQIRESEEFKKLMKLLAGYPLAMEVVLGNLRRQSPGEILAGLDAADINLDTSSPEKTASIVKCVEYSHSNLSPEAQKLLVCLAPFSGFIDRTDLPGYAAQLQQLEPFQGYPFEQFDGAIQEAIDWGLLSPKSADVPQWLDIQPVFPYFLKTKLQHLDASIREALTEGFKRHYQGLAGSYQRLMESKDSQQRQRGILFCQWEYENLYQALKICLEKQESVAIFYCLGTYFQLTNDIQSNLNLSEYVCGLQANYPETLRTGEMGFEIVRVLGSLANRYLQTKRYQEARNSYQALVELLEKFTGVDERQTKMLLARTYHQLGMVAEELREYEEARCNYHQALQINIEFNDRYEQADTYHQLGRVAEELREYEEARRNYHQALQINIEFNDRYSQARTYHHLGIVAQYLREYEEARRNYQLALQINIEFNDRYSQARTYHHLGMVAQYLREYEEARRNYQLALQINIEFNDRYSQASTYHQLGMVAEDLREYEEARRNYQLALQIFIEFNDRYSQASTYHQLGMVAQYLREYEEARRNYQLALQIFIEFNDRYEQAGTYNQLGLVAKAEGNNAEATTYFHQALAILGEFKDGHNAGIVQRNLDSLSA